MKKIVLVVVSFLLFAGIASAKNCLISYKNVNRSSGPSLELKIGEEQNGQCTPINVEPTFVYGGYDCIKTIAYNKNDTMIVIPGININGKCTSDSTVVLVDKKIETKK